ncbi:MAG TPA: hypothetical protein VE262_06325 [Blastocatellia bacterium]|nr:hypothetical protein [Blastocatellia bacterium]
MILILQYLLAAVSFVFTILVVVKLFQRKGVLHGILGIICGIYTFIWGWMNADREGIRPIMMAWTAVIILAFILGFLGGFSGYR